MTDPFVDDEVLAVLRSARPEIDDSLLSPRSPAAVMLLEKVRSPSPYDDDRPADRRSTRPQRRGAVPSRRILVGAAAAAVVIAAALTAVVTASDHDRSGVVFGSPDQEPRAAVSLGPIQEATAEAFAGTGRIEGVTTLEGDLAGEENDELGDRQITLTYEFSGDGLALFWNPSNNMNLPSEPTRFRFLDDHLYLATGLYTTTWTEVTDRGVLGEQFYIDPRTAFGDLDPSIQLEDLGTEEVDGVSTRHLRVVDPSSIPSPSIQPETTDQPYRLKSLDLWVDEGNVLRRLDLVRAYDVEDDAEMREHISLVFTDLGEPVTIETPPLD